MRSALDKLVSAMGLALAVVLLVAGGLLTWANSFIGNEVHNQFAQQQITMPSGQALTTADMKKYLGPYAGQEMTTGPQAKAYADHYILAHMNEASQGKSYAQVSSEQMAAMKADPNSKQTADLTALKTTLFQGSTLRGLLLYGYAFATVGTIAGYAAIVSFVGAVILLLLALLGFRHSRQQGVVDTEPTRATASRTV